MTVTKCDRCGKEIPASLKPHWIKDGFPALKDKYLCEREYHLCNECYSRFVDFVHGKDSQ